MCRSLEENVASEFVLTSAVLTCIKFDLHRWFARWEVDGLTAVVLPCVGCKIYSKQHTAFFCCSNLAFSLCISLESKWCNHTIALTRLLLERIPAFKSLLLYTPSTVHIHIFHLLYISYRLIGLLGRVFAYGLGNLGSIPGRVIPKTLKWYLILPCLTFSNIRYVSRVTLRS